MCFPLLGAPANLWFWPVKTAPCKFSDRSDKKILCRRPIFSLNITQEMLTPHFYKSVILFRDKWIVLEWIIGKFEQSYTNSGKRPDTIDQT